MRFFRTNAGRLTKTVTPIIGTEIQTHRHFIDPVTLLAAATPLAKSAAILPYNALMLSGTIFGTIGKYFGYACFFTFIKFVCDELTSKQQSEPLKPTLIYDHNGAVIGVNKPDQEIPIHPRAKARLAKFEMDEEKSQHKLLNITEKREQQDFAKLFDAMKQISSEKNEMTIEHPDSQDNKNKYF